MAQRLLVRVACFRHCSVSGTGLMTTPPQVSWLVRSTSWTPEKGPNCMRACAAQPARH